MTLVNEDYLFHRIDISKKPQCKYVKFKRAFQFLHLLLLQRVYGLDSLTHSTIRRASKQQQQQQCEFEVFLGGSCNPTTWRYEQAIPYFQFRSISCYNPQVANWTPDLVEIEHRAKEFAPLLFFVIDHSTRSLAAVAEVCYLAAREKTIIVVMNSMLEEKNQTKFIQEKHSTNENDNKKDFENVCEARRTLRLLLQSINIPVFDNLKVALQCAALVVENIKQNKAISDDWHSRQTSTESDDDGYGGSLESSHSILSRSSSPIYSDCGESISYENKSSKFYLPVLQTFFILCTFPFRFIRNLFPSVINSFEHSSTRFDLYVAAGDQDECWLNTIVFPLLQEINVSYIKRDRSDGNDELDIHRCKRSRLIYYLINDNERLSHLATELGFLIGERQHHIIVYLESIIKESSEEILTKNERQDIERSRRYLDDLAKKEKISLYRSREESFRHVLVFCLQDLVFLPK